MATVLSGIKVKVLQKGYHRMTLDFGNTYSDGSFHKGIDLCGNPEVNNGYDYICAVAGGKVTAYCNTIQGVIKDTGTKGMGNYVYIQTDDGYLFRYQHMTKGSVTVKTGDTVKAGQVIGYMGNTGNSTGRHLHFDVSKKGKLSGGTYVKSQDRTYFDPKKFLRGTLASTGSTVNTSTPAKVDTKLGNYVVKSDVNVRAGAGTKYAQLKYAEFTANAQSQIIKLKNKKCNYFPKGMTITISKISSDGKWGYCPSGWISLGYLKKA